MLTVIFGQEAWAIWRRETTGRRAAKRRGNPIAPFAKRSRSWQYHVLPGGYPEVRSFPMQWSPSFSTDRCHSILVLVSPATRGADTATYVWNIWVFRHEFITHGRFPL